ncbi:MAG: hypothetical protein GYA50_00685, partial [Eubacteriaceae bacterium]|nr:hypothetical protein [Eubacteriaceae bacterium]
MLIYFILSVSAIAIDNIYAIFGHGVRSAAMTYMFVYPLIGGVIFFALIRLIFPLINQYKGYRLFYNIYNSGIALLAAGSLFQGVLEIAGADSVFTTYFFIIGYAFAAAGFVVLIVTAIR